MIPYAGPHFQTNHVNDWPTAIVQFPAGTWVKAIDNVQLLDEAKRHNGGVKTVLRHFDGGWHNFELGALDAYKEHARNFFRTFIDDTFREYAHNVDAVEGLNEYNASSHSAAEIAERVKWAQAACIVWAQEYRTQADLAHIRLAVGNVAVGNDMPLETAQAIADYDAIAAYHCYVPYRRPTDRAAFERFAPRGQRPSPSYRATRAAMRGSEEAAAQKYELQVDVEPAPGLDALTAEAAGAAGAETLAGVLENEWPWLSGRWTQMDERFRAAGIYLDWLGTEAGPILYYDGGHLGPNDGWLHEDVCGGDVELYVAVIDYWMDRASSWNAQHGGRMLGKVLFNSGGSGGWPLFETQTPELEAMARHMAAYEPPAGEPPPAPEPPPEPELQPRRYSKTGHLVPQPDVLQRGQYDAVMDVAWPNANSVFFSVDDWALTAVNDRVQVQARTLIAWDVEAILNLPDAHEAQARLGEWVHTYYPEPAPELIFRRIDELFVADVWDPPVGSAEERAGAEVWPGAWEDANSFANRYQLGGRYYYHPGSDLNLNAPAWDMDRNMPVYAPASGQVVYAGVPSNAWQGVVVMRHAAPDGSVAYSRSAHLGQIFVEGGQWLKRGAMLGLTGRNMTDEGPGPFHLHFEVCVTELVAEDPGYWPPAENYAVVQDNWVDPQLWIAARR